MTTPATAQPIPLSINRPTEIIGTKPSHTETDVDYFSVDLVAGTVLYVFVVADLVGFPLNATLRIFDAQGNMVAADDEASSGLDYPLIRFPVPTTGVYRIFQGTVQTSRYAHYRMYVRVK